jgi:hypothetical protein
MGFGRDRAQHVGQSSGWRTVAEVGAVQGGIGVQMTVIRRSARRPSNEIIQFTRADGPTVGITVEVAVLVRRPASQSYR